MPSKYTKDTLKIEIEKIYGKGTYNTSKMEDPKSVDNKVTLICNKEGHGEFQKKIYDLINRKRGCPKCTKRPRIDTEYFKAMSKDIHKDDKGNPIYLYDKVDYINSGEKVIITCRKHGDFECLPRNHTNKKRGCPHCNGGIKLEWKDILKRLEKIHGDKYDYSKFVYKNFQTPSTIICKQDGHGTFEQNLNNHLNSKKGCPYCQNKTEGILNLILKDNFNYKIIHNRGFDWCKKKRKLRYDFIIEDLKIIIELDGRQHFMNVRNWGGDPDDNLQNDIFKNECAMENGYTMIRVFQEDIYNEKKDILEILLSSIHRYVTPQLICIGDIYNGRFKTA